MQYLYQIAGISVLCRMPFSIHIQKESAEFIYPAVDDGMTVDETIRFIPVSGLETMTSDGYWDIDRYHAASSVYYCTSPGGEAYAQVNFESSCPGSMICRYVRGKESFLDYSRNICDILSLETLLLHYNGFILHSSFIRWQQQGILFSAPSGTGKSTQADLWVEYEGAEIINGDRAGLRLIDGVWQAYGLPYAGSSHIYRNENAPVAAVVVLRQAKENRIRRLRAAEAIRFLYPEVTAHHWDREFVDRILNLLMELTEAVPVYLLECLPDRGAVELVKDTIFYANLPASE